MRPARLAAFLLLFASVIAAGPGPGVAEDLDPNALFDSAKASYGQKQYGKAMADLRLLMGEVARRRGEDLKSRLPAAPAGWTAGEAESEVLAFFSSGIVVRRAYTKEGSNVRLELVADSPIAASFASVFAMAQMTGQPIVKVKGRQAILEYDAQNRHGSVKLVLASNTALLSLEGDGVSKQDLVDGFGNALDLDGLEKALQE
jgi:hypothetical protein